MTVIARFLPQPSFLVTIEASSSISGALTSGLVEPLERVRSSVKQTIYLQAEKTRCTAGETERCVLKLVSFRLAGGRWLNCMKCLTTCFSMSWVKECHGTTCLPRAFRFNRLQ